MMNYKSIFIMMILCIIIILTCSCGTVSITDNKTFSMTIESTLSNNTNNTAFPQNITNSTETEVNAIYSTEDETILQQKESGPFCECEVHDPFYHNIEKSIWIEDKFFEWKSLYNDIYSQEDILEKYRNGECPYPESNKITYIKYCGISKDKLIEYINPDKRAETFPYLLEQNPNYLIEEYDKIDAIYSDDIERINLAFKNKDAVYANGRYYSKGWLYNHTAEDYEKENLPMDQLMGIYKQYEKEFQAGEMQKILIYGVNIGYSTLES